MCNKINLVAGNPIQTNLVHVCVKVVVVVAAVALFCVASVIFYPITGQCLVKFEPLVCVINRRLQIVQTRQDSMGNECVQIGRPVNATVQDVEAFQKGNCAANKITNTLTLSSQPRRNASNYLPLGKNELVCGLQRDEVELQSQPHTRHRSLSYGKVKSSPVKRASFRCAQCLL